MRRGVWMMLVSLDGFIEGPDGELDRHLVDDELPSTRAFGNGVVLLRYQRADG